MILHRLRKHGFFLFFLCLSMVSLFFGLYFPHVVQDTRAFVWDRGSAVVLSLQSVPDFFVLQMHGFQKCVMNLHESLPASRQIELLTTRIQDIEAENTSLKKMIKLRVQDSRLIATGRSVVDAKSLFHYTILLNVGHDEGVQEGDFAVVHDSLLGRVVAVFSHACRVLLLDDERSSIPVFLRGSEIHGILKGANGSVVLSGVQAFDQFDMRNDIVLTSGLGGALPPDIPVATVVDQKSGKVLLKLLISYKDATYVSIFRHEPLVRGKEEKEQ